MENSWLSIWALVPEHTECNLYNGLMKSSSAGSVLQAILRAILKAQKWGQCIKAIIQLIALDSAFFSGISSVGMADFILTNNS